MNPHAPPGFDVQFCEVALEIALRNSCKQYSFFRSRPRVRLRWFCVNAVFRSICAPTAKAVKESSAITFQCRHVHLMPSSS